jgi:hypothetical protein
MAQNRFTKIKGTKDFLVVAVVCVFLCLWSIRDAWFPTQSILKKHPLTYSVVSKTSGVVQSVPVHPGQKIGGSMVLVELAVSSHQRAVDEAEAAYTAAKESEAPDKSEKLAALHKAKEALLACKIRNTDFTLETTHGEEALNGKVLEIFARPAVPIEAGEVLMTVEPHDTFYIFNKTLAVLTFLGAGIALFFHRIASK